MSENSQRLWIQDNLNKLAIGRALEQIHRTGAALPCAISAVNGQIVTVSFEVDASPFTLPPITIPIATSKYDWVPLQVGDLGVTVPSDVYLGGISGLGGGTADLTQRANLSALVFVPVSNSAWAPPGGDGNMRIVQGPDGVRIQDTTGAVVAIFSKTGGITFSFGGKTWTFNASGFTMSDGIIVESHLHSGIQPGSSNTGGPVSG